MAIDPIFIAVADVPDWIAAGGVAAATSDRRTIDARAARPARGLRRGPCGEEPGAARRLRLVLVALLDTGDARDRALAAFRERERWWLDDYALFRALHDEHGGRHWREWEPGVRDREPAALDEARGAARRRRFATTATCSGSPTSSGRRRALAAAPVGRVRRLPVHGQRPQRRRLGASARVRSRRVRRHAARRVLGDRAGLGPAAVPLGRRRRRRVRVAAPARPPLRRALRRLPRRSPGRVLPHLRPQARRPPGFWPAGRAPAARAWASSCCRSSPPGGASPIAEDLGTVPDFVRVSLAARGIPGMKVLRWERDWTATASRSAIRPAIAEASVATTGTHDTETAGRMVGRRRGRERRALLALSGAPRRRLLARRRRSPIASATRSSALLFGAGSRLVDPADPGHLRLARPHQHAGGGRRRQLDLAAAAGRSTI